MADTLAESRYASGGETKDEREATLKGLFPKLQETDLKVIAKIGIHAMCYKPIMQ